MDTLFRPPNASPVNDLPAHAYRHLIYTLISLLPPPPVDTPEAWLARDQAAIAKVADLLPVNADEADLAAQCVIARAQAEDIMRLLRLHADDLALTIKLNSQYIAMTRASLSAHGHLTRAQQARRKREQKESAANTDEWTRHIATALMQQSLAGKPQVAEGQEVSKIDLDSREMQNETPDRPAWNEETGDTDDRRLPSGPRPPRNDKPAQSSQSEPRFQPPVERLRIIPASSPGSPAHATN
jgi:hypothetical protein